MTENASHKCSKCGFDQEEEDAKEAKRKADNKNVRDYLVFFGKFIVVSYIIVTILVWIADKW